MNGWDWNLSSLFQSKIIFFMYFSYCENTLQPSCSTWNYKVTMGEEHCPILILSREKSIQVILLRIGVLKLIKSIDSTKQS